MALPKEPRQKMINMMYLVLTALLALNVSTEILNAFTTINNSLMTASANIENRNSDLFKSFQKKLDSPKTRDLAAAWFPKAEEAKKISDELYNYLEALKEELIQEAGGYVTDEESGEKRIKSEDNLDAATRLFISAPPNGKGKGNELYEKLKQYKERLLALDPVMSEELATTLPLDLTIPKTNNKAGKNDWAYNYFHMTPTVAGVTILSKFQNDVRNSEVSVVDYFHKKVGEVEVVYDEFQAFAGTSSQYLMPGEELIITAGVGAFSKAAKPSVAIDGVSVPMKPDGTFEYKLNTGNSGSFTKKVRVAFIKPDGTTATVERDVKYTVGVPAGLSVSTDKTRVFYQGLDNELVIAGAGDEKLQVNVSGNGVSARKDGPGKYIVTCTSLGVATVTATDGKNQVKANIPIKRVPSPLAMVGGRAGGEMAANVFRAQRGVQAVLNDFVFEGVKYDVVSFLIYCTGKGFEESGGEAVEVKGAYFSQDALNLVKRCQPGTTVVIDEIVVVGPPGRVKLDQNISFTLN